MKIIRPEYTPPKEELIDDNTFKEELKKNVYTKEEKEYIEKRPIMQMPELSEVEDSIISLMQQTIDENKIKVEFTLTKRQYYLWQKKGEVAWLKKALVGARLKKSRK